MLKKALAVIISVTLVFTATFSSAFADGFEKGNKKSQTNKNWNRGFNWSAEWKEWTKEWQKWAKEQQKLEKEKEKAKEKNEKDKKKEKKQKDQKSISVIKYGRILIPVAALTKGFDAELEWNDKDNIITITKDKRTMEWNLETNIIKIDKKTIDYNKYIPKGNNSTIVPFKLIMNVLGCDCFDDDDFYEDEDKDEDELKNDYKLDIKKIVASSTLDGHKTEYVADGKMNTRWSSKYEDDEWIYFDLGSKKQVSRMVLHWEKAYAEEYEIEISNDGKKWSKIYSESDGKGGKEEIAFKDHNNTRYVRINLEDRATKYGFSLWEVEIYSDESRLEVDSESITGTVDLTKVGTKDWVHWGYKGATKVNRKDDVKKLISDFSSVDDGEVTWFSGMPVKFSWSDGEPSEKVTDGVGAVYLNKSGKGDGFKITVPAYQEARTLKLYVGAWDAKGKLEVSLTDGSKLNYTGYVDSDAGIKCSVFTIDYSSIDDDEELIIKYTIDKKYNDTYGNILIQAAALR